MLLPPQIRCAPLLKDHRGYRVIPDLVSPAHGRELLREAIQAITSAVESNVPRYDGEAWRGGNPARKFLSAHAGPVQQALYHDPGMVRFLEQLLGCRVIPSGTRGTYTYYSRPGDFLGIHRDVDTCDVAVISCLSDVPAARANAGKLVFYPSRLTDDNTVIRRNPAAGAVLHRLQPGETLVLMGGIVAHAVLPVAPGQKRIVSVLCYTASEG